MRHTLGIIGGALLVFGAGFVIGTQQPPRDVDSELAMAQSITQNKNVKLIGFVCGDHDATVIAEYEDEFPPCVEIRPLSEQMMDDWKRPDPGLL